MSATQRTKELVIKLMKDGKVHKTSEIYDMALEKHIIRTRKTNIIQNVVYQLKKDGYIRSTGYVGEYILANAGDDFKEEVVVQEKIVQERQEKKNQAKINSDKYVLLQPQRARLPEMKISIVDKGELRLNATLMNKIKTRKIEIFLSKDYHNIILNPDGPNAHEFTKAGTAKNREIVAMLKKLRVSFPVVYTVLWNDENGVFEGEINIPAKV